MAPLSRNTRHGRGEGRPFRGHVAGLVAIQPAVEGFLRVAGDGRASTSRRARCRRVGAVALRGEGGELAARQARAFLEPLADLPQARLAPLEHRIEVRIESGMRLVDLQARRCE